MPLIMFKIAACSTIAIIQPVPLPLCLLPPIILSFLWNQFTWYPLCWQIGSPLPLLDGLSVGLVALVPLPHISILPPSGFAAFILLPQVQTMMMSITLMPGITSTVIRIFQWCLNATMGVMLRLPIFFPFSLRTFMLPLLHLAWVRTSIDLIGSRVLPVMKVQVDVEGISM